MKMTQPTWFVKSLGAIALSAAIYSNFPGANALPSTRTVAAAPILYQSGTHMSDSGATIFLSAVAPTIFGQDATDFDFMVASDPGPAISAIHQFSDAYSAGTSENLTMVTFLNATMAGSMTTAESSDVDWLCHQLHKDMRSHFAACAGVQTRGVHQEMSVEKRWQWRADRFQASKRFAMNTLAGIVGNAIYAYFPESPRSLCVLDSGVSACISWSKVETFNHRYAAQLMDDAFDKVDFNTYSAIAFGVIGQKKRSGADFCMSNTATNCH